MAKPTQDQINAELARLEAADGRHHEESGHELAIRTLRDRMTPGQVHSMWGAGGGDDGEAYDAAVSAAMWMLGLCEESPSTIAGL